MAAKILVVEDDADLHIGIALRLKFAGYEVMSAMDGLSAIEVCEQTRPNLILMDVGLPGIDGHEVARHLASHPQTSDVPVVYLTARHETKHRLQAADLGAAAYLVKPTSGANLVAAIEAALPAGQF